MTPTELLLGILATWRITSLLSNDFEKGPKDILRSLRHKLGVRWDEKSEPYGTTEIAKGLLCFWCCSVWVGGGLAIVFSHTEPWLIPVVALAFSGGAIVLWELATSGW